MNQDTAFWIAVCSVPIVGGFHRYAVSYGYRGASRAQALGEAYRVATMLAVCCGLFAVAKMF